MRCFKCNCELIANKDVCVRCGQDVRLYKKIYRTSNAYYNIGLAKAKVRDLTGAVNALRTSLSMDKTNIDARNLLGLVYFEMGETAYALREWVISKNILEEDNDADYYIRLIQSNPNKFEVIANSIHKYNFALKYAQEDGHDLAVIQLKKIVASNPKFIRAYLLLALLYMEEKQYHKAEGLLKKVLKIDKGNTTARRYLTELRRMSRKSRIVKNPESVKSTGRVSSVNKSDETKSEEEGRKDKDSNPKLIDGLASDSDDDNEFDRVIIPVYTRAFGSYFGIALYVLLGIVLGIGVLSFVVVPAVQKKYSEQYREELIKYQTNVSTDKVTIADLENACATLEKEKKNLNTKIDQLQSMVDSGEKPGVPGSSSSSGSSLTRKEQEQYDYVIALLRNKIDDKAEVDVKKYAAALDIGENSSEELQKAYEYVQTLYVNESNEFFDEGYKEYEKGNDLRKKESRDYLAHFDKAIECMKASINLNPQRPDGYAWIGVCYHHMAKTPQAKEYYKYYLDHFAGKSENLENMVTVQLKSIEDAESN